MSNQCDHSPDRPADRTVTVDTPRIDAAIEELIYSKDSDTLEFRVFCKIMIEALEEIRELLQKC